MSGDAVDRVLSGRIAYADGPPVVGMTVRAYNASLRAEEELGNTVTDDDGSYAIPLQVDDGRGLLNLRMRVFDPDGRELAASPVRFRSAASEAIDLVIGSEVSTASEFERYVADARAALGGGQLRRMRAGEIEFLQGDLGIPGEHLEALVEAARRQAEPGPERPRLPTEVWYGWHRAGLGLDPGTLWQRRPDELVNALRGVVSAGVLPARIGDELESLRDPIRVYRLEQLLDDAPAATPGSLRALLGTLPEPLGVDVQRTVAEVLFDERPEPAELPQSLERAGLSSEQVGGTIRTLRLAEVTSGHAPLMAALQPIAGDDGDGSLQPLASVPADEWLDLAFQHGAPAGAAPEGIALDEVRFATDARARVEELHPTATLAARLDDGSVTLAIPGGEEVAGFLAAHPDFDVVATPIEDYIAGLPADPGRDGATLASALQTVRRMQPLTATWEDASAVLDLGLRSPFDIAGKDQDRVVELLEPRMPADEARAIHARASAVEATTVALVGALREASPAGVAALPGSMPSEELLSQHPTLQALLGSLDHCACGRCRSVFSPSAYLVDLLRFVQEGPPLAFAALMARRADLVDIELSCENAEQEVPAIDLALEVLENQVGLPLTVELPAGTDVTAALGGERLPDAVVAVLQRTATDVGTGLRAAREPAQLQRDGYLAWTVADGHRRWILRQSEESLRATLPSKDRDSDPVPSEGLDFAAVVAGLDDGSVPAELDTRLRSIVSGDPLSTRAVAPEGVEVLQPGRRWRVTYRVQFVVGTDLPGGDQGTITLLTTDDTVVASHTYSAAAVSATATALEAGEPGGMLSVLVPEARAFAAAPAPVAEHWALTREPIQVEISYVPSALTVDALTYQSATGDAASAAAPQNRNPEAYARLRDALCPWSLPFDLPLEETRALLARAGVSRRELLERWLSSTAQRNFQVAMEHLELSAQEVHMITTPMTEPALWQVWGAGTGDGGVFVWDAAAGEHVSGPPLTVFARISVLLQQARISHAELTELLGTRFIRGAGVTPASRPVGECRPSAMTLDPINAAFLDRLHRFIRLWRKLGWTVADLDAVIAALGEGGEITSATVQRLSYLGRVHEQLSVPIDELASWWGGIASLHQRLFGDASARSQPDPDFELNDAGTALRVEERGPVDPPPELAEKLGGIATAFRTRESDLDALLDVLPLRPAEARPLPLTLDTLSRLWRAASLARALGLSADEYARAIRVTEVEPFPVVDVLGESPPAPRFVLEFCAAVGLVRGSAFTLEELAYLLRHDPDPIGISDAAAAELLAGTRAAMAAVRRDVAQGGAEPAAQLRSALAALGWYAELVDGVVADLAAAGTAETRARVERRLSAAELPVFAADTTLLAGPLTLGGGLRDRCRVEPTADGTGSRLVVSGWVDPDDADALAAALGSGHDAALASLRSASDAYREGSTRRRLLSAAEVGALLAASVGTSERYERVLEAVVRHRRIMAGAAQLAQALGLPPEVVADLVLDLLAIPGTNTPAIELLLEPSFADTDAQATVTPTAFPQTFGLVRRLQKVALVATRLDLDGPTLAALAGNGPEPSRRSAGLLAIDLSTLPGGVEDTDVPAGFFAWERTAALVRLRAAQPGGQSMMAAYAQAVLATDLTADERRTAALDVLAGSTGQAVEAVAAAGAQVFQFGLTYYDPLGIEAVLDLVAALARLGARPDQVPDLIAYDATAGGADLARSLLRARHPGAAWAEVLRPVSDALRVRQRDALVDHLVSTRNLGSADELYEHLLIDVLTGPCLSTTRILQATAAVQLFVHRCLLNLEPAVPTKGINRQRWEWMKSYRVWEANRKVFLWPQNWLHPELREDASDAFQGVLSSLGGDEPSAESARQALLGYVDDLVELSQLKVVGMFQHRRGPEAGAPSDLYVVGRSAEPPVRNFWRVCEDIGGAGMRWRPWQRVELDISGTHVMPFVLGGDLHLAWPMLRKVQTGSNPAYWELQLAWARHSSRGWSQKTIGRDTVTSRALVNKDEPSSFTFALTVQQLVPAATTQEAWLLSSAAAEEAAVVTCYAAGPRDTPIVPPPEVESGAPGGGLFNAELRLTVRAYATRRDLPGTYWHASGARALLTIRGAKTVSASLEMGPGGELSMVLTPAQFVSETGGVGGVAVTQIALAFLTGDITLQVDYQGQTSPIRTFPRNAATSGTFLTWAANFIFEVAEAPFGLADPERPVSWGRLGSFVLSASGGMSWQPGRGPAVLGRLLYSDVQYENGVREPLGREFDDLTVVSPTGTLTFAATPGRFDLVPANPQEGSAFGQVGGRQGVVWHYRDGAAQYYLHSLPSGQFRVDADGYPLAARFRRDATANVRTLFDPAIQAITDGGSLLRDVHRPQPALAATSRTRQGIVFDHAAPYGTYNWELFLHIPVLIAAHLSRQQRFQEAEEWLRLVFDPTSPDARSVYPANPSLYWRFLPFRTGGRPDRIEDLLRWLANPTAEHHVQDFIVQINRWKDNPFRPHDIARMRPGAYQWDVLFAYIDNLLDWGDERFRRDTRESLIEATMLYVQAAKLLGPRPRTVRSSLQPPALTYRALAGRWDEFSNAWYSLADTPLARALLAYLQWLREHNPSGPSGVPSDEQALAALRSAGLTYFCVPFNERLLDYWNRVEDRLFKIRYCQNIEGVERELPLFEPPIDPDLLVRAVAAGVDLDQAVADTAAPLLPQRFGVLLQRADALAAELRSLGAAVLAALEKKDAERLARLRSGHEVAMLELAEGVRREQAEEAHANVDALLASRDAAASRYSHYQYLLTGVRREPPEPGSSVVEEPSRLQLAPSAILAADEQGLGLLMSERDQLAWLEVAGSYALFAGISNAVAAVFFAIGAYPVTTPIQAFGHAANATGSVLNTLSANANQQAARDALISGYQRRRDEWTLQSNNALREIAQIDKQIAAVRIRAAIADHELANHGQQLAQSRHVDDFMRDKYTNEQLYDWMTGQLAAAYFRTYQLALDMARGAERALRYELYQPDAQFIQPRYWDTLHKGLLAGEQLSQDLRRMEAAALERDRREHELTRHVSLLQLDPLALLELRATGRCTFEVPERLFDFDSPGHFLRRLKTVAVSIPAVAGPYAAVHAKLTLLRSTVRHRADVASGYARDEDEDTRFTDDRGLAESVVTSGTVEDSGVWEPALRDERRMPFEGRGAISSWRLELPAEFRQFDYDTITDVVLTLRYSARDGGQLLRREAVAALDVELAQVEGRPLALMVSVRHEFPSEWARLVGAGDGARNETLAIPTGRFPAVFGQHALRVEQIDVFSSPAGTAPPAASPAISAPPATGAARTNLTLETMPAIGPVRHDGATGLALTVAADPAAAGWRVSLSAAAARALRDVVLVFTYTATRRT